jgi:hypothetical protein
LNRLVVRQAGFLILGKVTVILKTEPLGARYNLDMQYQHTQNGKLMQVIVGCSIVFCLVIAGINGWNTSAGYSLFGAVLLLLVLLWLFSSLTVEVTEEKLTHWFGPGFWKKTYNLQEIETATQVRNSWIFGWGIRITPHGWLYNVSGLDAVQIQLRSGRKFRIGTDDPQGLFDAISENIP